LRLKKHKERIVHLAEAHPVVILHLAISVWVVLAILVIVQHELWRDEVRALTIALEPSTILQLPQSLEDEGHPLLWYILLRLVYQLFNSPVMLKIVSFVIGLGGAALFLYRAPLPVWVRVLYIFGILQFYEYTVMARNYGLTAFLLFLFAWCYRRISQYWVWSAVILILLANTNVHSAILTLALLVYWVADEFTKRNLGNRRIGLVSLLVLCGLFSAYLTARPTTHALSTEVMGQTLKELFSAFLLSAVNPGESFGKLFPLLPAAVSTALIILLSLLVGSRQTVSGLLVYATAVGLALFFSVAYRGMLRHQGLFFVFFLAIDWIVTENIRGMGIPPIRPESTFIAVARRVVFPFILLIHVGYNSGVAGIDLFRAKSSIKELSVFLQTNQNYRDAIIIGEPDYFLEALPYYASNEIFIPRERTFGKRVHFTTASQRDLSLSELLGYALQLKRQHGRPILIALGHPEFANRSAFTKAYPYHRTFSWSEQEKVQFTTTTRLIHSFSAATGDEKFLLFVVK